MKVEWRDTWAGTAFAVLMTGVCIAVGLVAAFVLVVCCWNIAVDVLHALGVEIPLS